MLHINPDKCLVQQPLRLEKPDPSVKVEMPYRWLKQLGMLVADDILKLSEDVKTNFLTKLESKAGPNSTYTLKAQLHESLIVVYVKLASAKTSPDQKMALALKVVEGIHNCTPGFHDRINEAVASLSNPENIDELLSAQRQSIVSNAASQESKGEVHAHNRFFVLARNLGYGVRPLNAEDIYQGAISDAAIKTKLAAAFGAHYAVFQILNALHEQLTNLMRENGYRGRQEDGYKKPVYQNFDSAALKPFIGDLSDDELFVTNEKWRIVDINWANLKAAMLRKMREEKYFIFNPKEEIFLDAMENDATQLMMEPETLSLFSTPDEMIQALVFFRECPTVIKKMLVHFYLINAKWEDQNSLLEKIEETGEIYKEIQADTFLQYAFLAKAVCENKLDKVKNLVAGGADINPHLAHLAYQQKNLVLQWLMSDTALRATLTQQSLHGIRETLINSKKGRQILLMDERLRGMCPDMIAGKSMNEWMQQAEAEKITRMRDGFFAAANPLVQQFLQHIIYGEQAQAEKILKDHPQMVLELLTTKLKVKDYSGRKIYGAALQLAAGAEDVRYHEDEICMVEMLTPYINSLPDSEQIMASQIAEQFPEGYEEQEQQRITDDEAALIKVLDAIGRSNNGAECELALQEFDNYLKPKGVIRTGKHFNEKLQEKAYELYDARYDEFGGWDSRKNNLAWRRVNGRIQRNYTACLAQAASQGLYYIVDKGEKLQRTLELRNDRGVRFYPLDLNPASRLGVDYAIGLCCVVAHGRWVAVPRRAAQAVGGCGGIFQNFVGQKNTIVGTTYAAARESSRGQGLRSNVVGD